MIRSRVLILSLLIATLLIAGCGGGTPSNPEEVVNLFWEAFVKNDFETLPQLVTADMQDEVRAMQEQTQGDDMINREMMSLLMGKFNIRTTGHTITDDTATVDAILSLPDMEYVITVWFAALLDLMGMEDEAAEEKLTEVFIEAITEADTVEKSIVFELALEERQWKLSKLQDLNILAEDF